jgi:hypothetical protein
MNFQILVTRQYQPFQICQFAQLGHIQIVIEEMKFFDAEFASEVVRFNNLKIVQPQM